MPTTTWLLEAKRLTEAEALPQYEARRQAEAKEELGDLQRELRALAVQWVVLWYERGGLYLGRGGDLEDFRLPVESAAAALDGPLALT